MKRENDCDDERQTKLGVWTEIVAQSLDDDI